LGVEATIAPLSQYGQLLKLILCMARATSVCLSPSRLSMGKRLHLLLMTAQARALSKRKMASCSTGFAEVRRLPPNVTFSVTPLAVLTMPPASWMHGTSAAESQGDMTVSNAA
jgi:hypothetical protein